MLLANRGVTLSADDFTALEEAGARGGAVRRANARARGRGASCEGEAQLAEETPVVEQLKQEIRTLRTERDQVRQRVERLLTQLDALEL